MAASAAADTGRAAPERARSACEPFLPLVVFPRQRGGALEASAPELRSTIGRYLQRAGAILFRGFPVSEDRDFERFVAAALAPPSARPLTERVWAWCALPGRGRRVLLADRRELHRAVPVDVRRRWAERGLHYVQRDERGRPLAARSRSPVAVHPLTREALWAQPEHAARAGAFGGLLGLASMPAEEGARRGGEATHWTVTHGDGSLLAERDVLDVNGAVDACRTELCLEARDVLLLDPALMAHAAATGAGGGIAVRRERG